MRITLGGKSYIKQKAIQRACIYLGIPAVINESDTKSGQNSQPEGFEETFAGALNRAKSAKAHDPEAVGVGIENGIFRFGKKEPMTLDIAVIVIITEDNRMIVTTSHGIKFPEKFVETAEKQDFTKTTVGSVIAGKLGGDPCDPHSTLTYGKVSRMETLTSALITALKQV